MSEILLGGLMAEIAAQIFPEAKFTHVHAEDVECLEDRFGMPVLAAKPGTGAQLLRISRLNAADLERLENLQNAYRLARFEIVARWEDQSKAIAILSSNEEPASRIFDAEAILVAVANAQDKKTAKAAIIGGEYRAAAMELASHEIRDLRYTHPGQKSDIPELSIETLSTGFYQFERFRYKHKRFDGQMARETVREMLTSGDAVIVLPYDPVLDKIVLIEQMRPAALARRSFDAWGLEAVAGVIGLNEKPEETAERELEEEAGLALKSLYPLAPCYQSPGTVSQMMYPFIASVDLTDYEPGIFGLAEEEEDIRSLVLTREEGVDLLRTGEANNAPLQILLYALALSHEKIVQHLLAGQGNPE